MRIILQLTSAPDYSLVYLREPPSMDVFSSPKGPGAAVDEPLIDWEQILLLVVLVLFVGPPEPAP